MRLIRLNRLSSLAFPQIRNLLGSGAVGGVALLICHLCSGCVLLYPAWKQLAPQARAELSSNIPHIALTQTEIAFAITLIGAVAGIVSHLFARGFGFRVSRLRVLLLTLGLIGLWTTRVIAQRPALLEDLLWRAGGIRAAAQVLIVERIGYRAIDLAIELLLALWLGAVLWRNRSRLRRTPVPIAAGLIVTLLIPLNPFRPHYRGVAKPVIVLAADSLRPDHFSSEGYFRSTTPNLDQLRKDAAWIPDFFSPIASTTASWASMLSGVYPHRHGVRDLFPRREESNLQLPTLPKILGAQGYQTVVVSDYAGEMFNRVRFGFDLIDAPPATSLEVFADREAFQRLPLAMALLTGSFGERLFPVGRYLPVNADPDLLTGRVEAHLDRLASEGRPFLLVVFYSVTHLPFAAPMPDANAFTRPDYRGPSRYSYEIQQIGDISRLSARPSESEADQVRALYDGALRSFDRQVGRVVRRLEQIGLKREQRLLIITGDHGEGLFEPGVTTEHGKWFAGGEAANRTPLLIQGGGVSPGTKARLASGVDFFPTIADALQLPIPDGLDGVSLLREGDAERSVFAETALWLGGEASAPPGAIGYPPLVEILEVELDSHALVLKRAYVEATVTAKLRAIRKGPWELIYTPTKQLPRWQLFNLRDDPFAERELSNEYSETFRSLRSELIEWLTRDPLRWLDANDRLISRTEQ